MNRYERKREVIDGIYEVIKVEQSEVDNLVFNAKIDEMADNAYKEIADMTEAARIKLRLKIPVEKSLPEILGGWTDTGFHTALQQRAMMDHIARTRSPHNGLFGLGGVGSALFGR